MQYLVIEMWENAEPNLVTDNTGSIKYFDTLEIAIKEAEDCQDGYVLDFITMQILKPNN